MSVILDATFAASKWRRDAYQIAADLDIDLIFVECTCTAETISARLKQREVEVGDSDARQMHLQRFIKSFEPFKPDDTKTHFLINTDQALYDILIQTLSKGYEKKKWPGSG